MSSQTATAPEVSVKEYKAVLVRPDLHARVRAKAAMDRVTMYEAGDQMAELWLGDCKRKKGVPYAANTR